MHEIVNEIGFESAWSNLWKFPVNKYDRYYLLDNTDRRERTIWCKKRDRKEKIISQKLEHILKLNFISTKRAKKQKFSFIQIKLTSINKENFIHS